MAENRKILLVDDQEFYRGALKKTLELQGFAVAEAENGKAAQNILAAQSFDLVISDISMPVMDGIALLQWIKATLKLPVILITGFSAIIETAEAHRLGADEFLLKPFHSADIFRAIENVWAKLGKGESTEDLDDQYCKIPLDEFVTGSRIHFSIFIRISSSKYVRIAYQGQDIALDRIRAYKAKGVKYVYVTRDDFSKYVGFSLGLLKKMEGSTSISTEKRQGFLRYTGELIMERLQVESLDEESFQSAREFTERMLDILSQDDALTTILMSLNSHADFLYAHSVGVSFYSVMIGRAMGWHSSPTLFKLGVGGLLHDLGLKEVPQEVLSKPRLAMSQEERKLYETHPTRGMELLNQVRCVPGDAILIAYQHHEDCTGFGYPKKLAKRLIHPMARVVAVADLFCELALKGPDSAGLPGPKAVTEMLQVGAERLDPEPLGALMGIFNVTAKKRAVA